MVVTAPEWPLKIFRHPPVSKDQERAVESADPEISDASGLNFLGLAPGLGFNFFPRAGRTRAYNF